MMYHPQLFWLYHPSGHAINLAEKDRAHDYADADEIRAEALALEDEDLANDLAAEEETRQNAYAAGDAAWLLDEAAAHIASTSIAAAATSSFLTGLAGADFLYVTTAAPLITTATQAFNNLVDADYVAAFPGDADQAAVSGAWTSYFNAMATAAQNAITTEASAYQAYINGMAADIQTTMNNIAGEAPALAGSYGAALVNLVSTVGAAATLHTSQSAAAGVVWVDTVATDVKNSEQAAANAWLVMADAGVDAVRNLADDFSNHWNSFAHNYLAAAAAHGTNVINEDRLAAKDADDELTTLAQGIAAEQHDLNLDDLAEWLSTALQLSAADDPVVIAWSVLESAWSILSAWMSHVSMTTAPLSSFAYAYPGGAGPMAGIMSADIGAAPGDDSWLTSAHDWVSQSMFWHLPGTLWSTFSDGTAYDSYRGAMVGGADILTLGIFDFGANYTSTYGHDEWFDYSRDNIGPWVGYPLLLAGGTYAWQATGGPTMGFLIGSVTAVPRVVWLWQWIRDEAKAAFVSDYGEF